jgi:hypothetical protein
MPPDPAPPKGHGPLCAVKTVLGRLLASLTASVPRPGDLRLTWLLAVVVVTTPLAQLYKSLAPDSVWSERTLDVVGAGDLVAVILIVVFACVRVTIQETTQTLKDTHAMLEAARRGHERRSKGRRP